LKQKYSVYLGIGMSSALELIVSVTVGVVLGGWLDRKLGTAPWCRILGIFLFMFVSLFHLTIMLRSLERRMRK